MASRRRQDRARDPAAAAPGRRARTLLVVRCPVAERKESRARDRQRESEATRIMRPHPRATRAREFPPPPPPALARAAPLCGAGGVEKHRKVCRKHDAQTHENIRPKSYTRRQFGTHLGCAGRIVASAPALSELRRRSAARRELGARRRRRSRADDRNRMRAVNTARTPAAPGSFSRARPRRANCVGFSPRAARFSRSTLPVDAALTMVRACPILQRSSDVSDKQPVRLTTVPPAVRA